MSDIIALRRHLHTLPELAFKEWNTLAYIVATLKQCTHLSFEYLPSGTYDKYKDLINTDKKEVEIEPGVFIDVPALKVSFDFAQDGENLAFRCDMDALPVEEAHCTGHKPYDLNFVSDNGNMHACAHDGHMAIALMSILHIDKNFEKLKSHTKLGSVSFIFQCAEEGCRGGIIISQSDFLKNVDTLYCYHLGMRLPSLSIATNPKKFLATQKFMLKMHGVKAHAGRPHQGVNALLPLCSIILDFMDYADTQNGIYINFGNMLSPGASNIVPDFASVFGEIRSNDAANIDIYYKKLVELIDKYTQDSKAVCELLPLGRAVGIENSSCLVQSLNSICSDLGFSVAEHFDFNASEDASLLIESVQKRGGQAMHFVIGANLSAEHHNALFDFDESVLDKACALILKIIESRS
ncbi:Indole-3-acetyl-aspartic acid hydrolase [Anaerobiospirillum thomasii]|uniref:Indole-3-acetyl-aspartic acid hydrolase n=1 Tax=Anaerobiospirillum thomasii TaxID=179995 RepID=A0A2X0V7Q2_9GAMM|nr:amidohydrolase [Anaerobiospirillum thomasii]SPT68019.1 Indole-3-acetyl-aspartic acid hydrolase [Anaerobiospirillum thomasii]SPT70484.1 Indole-3-acetyl-aspartic acid hydrolase [Anaerobiospirillum thomasii]